MCILTIWTLKSAGTLLGCLPNNWVAVSAGSRLSELQSLAEITDPVFICGSLVVGLVALAPILLKHRLGGNLDK